MSAIDRLGVDRQSLVRPAREYSEAQSQTEETFGFKWSRRDSYESVHMKRKARDWLVERYCDGNESRIDELLGESRKIILDAGCGSAFSAIQLFGDRLKDHDYLGVDISDAVTIAQERFSELGYPGDFIRCSLTDIPIPNGSVDVVLSEGVLHHTDSTEQSLIALSTKLRPGGLMMFYVYRKKAVIREFADDFIREQISGLSDEEAWEALKPLSKLGVALGELNVEIDIPEDIPFLGISKGRMDIQRFFYWNICKQYFDPTFNLEEMNHINFDWYRPTNCHRHTADEVEGFCRNARLTIQRLHEGDAGITVIATKDD